MNPGEGLEEQTEEERQKELWENTDLTSIANETQCSFCSSLCLQSCMWVSKLFHVILRTAWEVDNAALLSPSASEETNMQKVQLSDRARE